MVLINTVTKEAINTALIALQRGQNIVIGGEKEQTINNITITNQGASGNSKDFTPQITALSEKVGLLEKAEALLEEENARASERISALEQLQIEDLNYEEQTRVLTLTMSNGETLETMIPPGIITAKLVRNELIFTSGSGTASVQLPYISETEKGVPNGVATLDANGRIPYSQLAESAMELKGEWSAATNTPHLADGEGTNGDFYICNAGGTVNFGTEEEPREITFIPNDRVVYNGSTDTWIRLPAGQVESVNGMSGNVVLDIPPAQIQSDWAQTDSTKKDYIKNKLPIWIESGSADDNMTPVDRITVNESRPVTSNAVAEALSYSTTEHIVGYWIDGTTPIYEKTFVRGFNVSANENSFNIGQITGVNRVLYLGGITCTENGFSMPIPFTNGPDPHPQWWNYVNYNMYTGYIYFACNLSNQGTGLSTQTIITIRYTKA